jgi:UDP-N-acetylglucosamine diphosphorylase/glucosamine-1-phosphate N-acetyltransferase
VTLGTRLARDVPELTVHTMTSFRDWNRDGSVLLEHVWQLIEHNAAALADDFKAAGGSMISPGARVDAGVHILQPESVRLEDGVRLRPGVVLDAESGPITIGAGADVQPHVVIRGPASIGPHCLLKAGTKIQGDTSLGPVCKMAGEIAATIVQGYSNKQHEGFLGHAYLAEWVNLGADTNNSDLKNNYGSVRMWEAGEFVDTGLLFAGLVAADHVRCAINTQFNTGTVVDVCSQIAMTGFPPKYVPPFSWCGPTGIEVYDIERALRTARTVMARRECVLTPAYAAALRRIFAERGRHS